LLDSSAGHTVFGRSEAPCSQYYSLPGGVLEQQQL